MSFPRSRAAVLMMALASLPFVASAQDTKPADDPVVATVNGDKVYRSEVLEAARGLPPQYQAQMQQIFPMLVERVVDFRLLSEAADEAGLAKDEEVKRRLAKLQNDVMREIYLQRQIDEKVDNAALRTRYDAACLDAVQLQLTIRIRVDHRCTGGAGILVATGNDVPETCSTAVFGRRNAECAPRQASHDSLSCSTAGGRVRLSFEQTACRIQIGARQSCCRTGNEVLSDGREVNQCFACIRE